MRENLLRRYLIPIVALTGAIVLTLSGGLFAVNYGIMTAMYQSSDTAMSASLLDRAEGRAKELGNYLAENMTVPLYRLDIRSMHQLLEVTATQEGVDFVYVFDAQGTVLHDGSNNIERYARPVSAAIMQTVVAEGGHYQRRTHHELVVAVPVRIGSQILGGIAVGLSLDAARSDMEALKTELKNIRRDGVTRYVLAALLIAALSFAGGALISLLVARTLSGPLKTVSGLIEEIGQGNYDVDTPFPDGGEIGALGASLKRTAAALKETTISRAYFDNIFNSMIDPLFVVSPTGGIEAVNQAALDVLGYSRAEMTGRPISTVLRGVDPDGVPCQPAASPRSFASSQEAFLVDRDGGQTPVHISAAKMTGPDPARASTICVAQDISRRLEREKALRRALDDAELANRAKTDFLASMSHELRTPLNAIIGFSEMIAGEHLGPIGQQRYREYAHDIGFSGTHLLEIINNMLDMAKIESAGFTLNEGRTDAAKMMEDTAKMVLQKAAAEDIDLKIACADDMSELYVDERIVRQMLLNLISNAIKFTPAQGTVCVDLILDGQGRPVFTVADTGAGIAPHDIDRVMQPFGQVENPFSKKYPGTGLGLPLAVSFAEIHGGTLKMESELGAGTTVTVTLPAARALGAKARSGPAAARA